MKIHMVAAAFLVFFSAFASSAPCEQEKPRLQGSQMGGESGADAVDNIIEKNRFTAREIQQMLNKAAGKEPLAAVDGLDENMAGEDEDEVERDPFSITDAITRVLGQMDRSFKGSVPGKVPKMLLKGFILDPSGEKRALLQIEDKTHVVRSGDIVGVYVDGKGAALRIREVARNHVLVEYGSVKQLIIVN